MGIRLVNLHNQLSYKLRTPQIKVVIDLRFNLLQKDVKLGRVAFSLLPCIFEIKELYAAAWAYP